MISTQKHRKEVYLGQNYKHPSVCHLDQLRKMANSEKNTQQVIFSPWNTLAILLYQLLLVKQLFLLVIILWLSLLLRRFFPEIDQYLRNLVKRLKWGELRNLQDKVIGIRSKYWFKQTGSWTSSVSTESRLCCRNTLVTHTLWTNWNQHFFRYLVFSCLWVKTQPKVGSNAFQSSGQLGKKSEHRGEPLPHVIPTHVA